MITKNKPNLRTILLFFGISAGILGFFNGKNGLFAGNLELFPALGPEMPEYLKVQANTLLPTTNPASNGLFLYEIFRTKTTIRVVTAYQPVVGETDETPCIVASGLNACESKKKIVACPRNYPLGTKVMIDGKIYSCEDRTNIKYDGVFDIFCRNENEVKKWGKRVVPVTVID